MKWIVVEDSINPTPLVSSLLSHCPVSSVHLSVRTPRKKTLVGKLFWKIMHGHRGLEQRNIALQWLRDNYSTKDCHGGVIYFADDDNRYDHRIFDVVSTFYLLCWFLNLHDMEHKQKCVFFKDLPAI